MVFGVENLAASSTIEQNLEHDKKKIDEILMKIGAKAKPTFFKRMRGRDNKPGPILVGLPEVADRNPILLGAKELRNDESFGKVFISPDLTEAERYDDYLLRKKRDELNNGREPNSPFRNAIRGNQITKFRVLHSESPKRSSNGGKNAGEESNIE